MLDYGASFISNDISIIFDGCPPQVFGVPAPTVRACVDGSARKDNTSNWTGLIGSNGGPLEDEQKSTPCGTILLEISDRTVGGSSCGDQAFDETSRNH